MKIHNKTKKSEWLFKLKKTFNQELGVHMWYWECPESDIISEEYWSMDAALGDYPNKIKWLD